MKVKEYTDKELENMAEKALNNLFNTTSLEKPGDTSEFNDMVNDVAQAIKANDLPNIYSTTQLCKVVGIHL